MTSMTCVVEDGGEVRTGMINKHLVSLADVKTELNIGQMEGVYLAKTQDGQDSFYWSIIVNDQDIVPCLFDGSISIKVRPTFSGFARLLYQIEGTFDPHPHVCTINKLATHVTLRDVISYYKGNHGTFFFKEFDESGGYHWTIVTEDDEVVPSFDGQITCKVRLHPQKKEGQWTVLAYQIEGVIHPKTTRIPKPPSQVTVQDIRQGYVNIHGVMAGEMFIRSGNQYIPLTDPEIANGAFPDSHCLIQIRVRPFSQQHLPLNPLSNGTEPFSIQAFDPALLPTSSTIHSAPTLHPSPSHQQPQPHAIHHQTSQIQQQPHAQPTPAHIPQQLPLQQLSHMSQMHLQYLQQQQQHQILQQQLQQHIQPHLQPHQLQQPQHQVQHLQQHQLQHHQQQLLHDHQLQHIQQLRHLPQAQSQQQLLHEHQLQIQSQAQQEGASGQDQPQEELEPTQHELQAQEGEGNAQEQGSNSNPDTHMHEMLDNSQTQENFEAQSYEPTQPL